jgi:hypothetical protein
MTVSICAESVVSAVQKGNCPIDHVSSWKENQKSPYIGKPEKTINHPGEVRSLSPSRPSLPGCLCPACCIDTRALDPASCRSPVLMFPCSPSQPHRQSRRRSSATGWMEYASPACRLEQMNRVADEAGTAEAAQIACQQACALFIGTVLIPHCRECLHFREGPHSSWRCCSTATRCKAKPW